jgi:hypothetical protein
VDPFFLLSIATFDKGPVQSLAVPAVLVRQEESYLSRGTVTEFKTKDGTNLTVAVFDVGRPLSQASRERFTQLLSGQPIALAHSQISELSEVLGRTTLGDNQLVNKAIAPDPSAPAFNLESAVINKLNERSVLEVAGSFVDRNGKPSSFYRGVFVPADNNGVEQIYMQTSTKEQLDDNIQLYRDIIESIRWR